MENELEISPFLVLLLGKQGFKVTTIVDITRVDKQLKLQFSFDNTKPNFH